MRQVEGYRGDPEKEPNMATRTRTGNRVTATQFKSKTDAMRSLYESGETVTSVAAKVGVGYAFTYGVAKRYGFATTEAHRKPTRLVSVANGIVTVQTAIGPVSVHPDGSVTKPKAARSKTPA